MWLKNVFVERYENVFNKFRFHQQQEIFSTISNIFTSHFIIVLLLVIPVTKYTNNETNNKKYTSFNIM